MNEAVNKAENGAGNVAGNGAGIGIIGGGAAGLFAGCFLKKRGIGFTILERNDKPGRKLLLTGRGRCNITNRKQVRELRDGYREAGSFIYRVLKDFTPENAIDFIERELHIPLKEEENGRMFPRSDRAGDILTALINYIGDENIVTGFHCVSLGRSADGYEVRSADGFNMRFSRIVLACGGVSYPRTGSDGSGFILAREMGHSITELVPALAAIDVSREDREFTSALRGVSVNAGTSLYYDRRKRAEQEGDIMFTHRGVTGPAIHEISREIPRDIGSRDGWIEIDFTPGRTETEVDEELLRQMKEHTDAKLVNLVSEYVPQSVANRLGERAGVSDIYAGKASRNSRKAYVSELKHLKLSIDNPPSYEEAYVTRGGVSLREIERDTMESRLSKGLYIIGEMLDVDGRSGGYNLQACISEAWAVAKSLAE